MAVKLLLSPSWCHGYYFTGKNFTARRMENKNYGTARNAVLEWKLSTSFSIRQFWMFDIMLSLWSCERNWHVDCVVNSLPSILSRHLRSSSSSVHQPQPGALRKILQRRNGLRLNIRTSMFAIVSLYQPERTDWPLLLSNHSRVMAISVLQSFQQVGVRYWIVPQSACKCSGFHVHSTFRMIHMSSSDVWILTTLYLGPYNLC
jgi:hypothetical protein